MGEIPIIALVVLLVLSSPDEQVSVPAQVAKSNSVPVQMQAAPKTNIVVEPSSIGVKQNDPSDPGAWRYARVEPQEEVISDYQAIRQYIHRTFKRVSDEDADEIAKYLVDYGREHDLDPKLAAALIARESGFNKNAISSTGAKGLGQIKNFNYPSLGISDPHDIKQNVKGTTEYLKRMLSIWKGKSEKVSLALASYYKGHGAVKRDNEQLDQKTMGYVRDILKNYEKISQIQKTNTQ